MTWNHYNAHLADINGRKAYARIECDKSNSLIIIARIGYFQPNGIVGYDDMSHAEPNTAEGEAKLVRRIKAYANKHGLKFTSEEFTEFSNQKPK